jgi:hypothetical protein
LKCNKKEDGTDNNISNNNNSNHNNNNNKYNNNNNNKRHRERSRENEIQNDYNSYNNAAVNYYNQAFTIPRGFFRNPNIRGGRFPIMTGMTRVPNDMSGFMRAPGIRPRAPFQKNLE